MKLNRIASAFVAILLVAPTLFAADDVSGKWAGSFVITVNGGSPRDHTAYMVLKHTGVAAAMAIVATFAAFLPARRAASSNPVTALRGN
jgi:ABC-type antimicrobial peptide transport system permease subunit